ncbi:11717_t:CDS:2, partial [Ambispora leptoticha]
GLNNHIKTAINSSSTLLQVMEAIQQRIEQIVQQINKYLTPNLATEPQKQIVQSTIYRAQIFNLWDSDNSLNLQEITYDNDFIENIYDISQLYLLALIKKMNILPLKKFGKPRV